MGEIIEHLHRDADNTKVKLIRYTKGYGWEISIRGERADQQKILQEIGEIDDSLKTQWGEG